MDMHSVGNNEEREPLSLESGLEIVEDVTPRDLLQFAKVILGVLAVLFMFGGISELIHPNNAVFETCKTVLPSIATLVIGYYFGASSKL